MYTIAITRKKKEQLTITIKIWFKYGKTVELNCGDP